MIDGKYRMSVTSIWLLLLMTAVLFQLPEPVVALRGDRVDRPVAGSAPHGTVRADFPHTALRKESVYSRV